jgi:hypothetical protein
VTTSRKRWFDEEMKMTNLNNFFNEERKRVFEPGPFFTQKVMARLKDVARSEISLWDAIPGAVRPVFAVALMLLFAVLAVQILVPVEPSRGAIDAAMTSGLTPSEVLLFTGAEAPTNSVYIQELILEPGQ